MSTADEDLFQASFSSPRAKENFDRAVRNLLILTGSADVWRARCVVSGIAAYVAREHADRTKT